VRRANREAAAASFKVSKRQGHFGRVRVPVAFQQQTMPVSMLETHMAKKDGRKQLQTETQD
jgi:hypothetical protein